MVQTRMLHQREDEKKLIGKTITHVTISEGYGLSGLIFNDGSHIVIVINIDGCIDFLLDESPNTVSTKQRGGEMNE